MRHNGSNNDNANDEAVNAPAESLLDQQLPGDFPIKIIGTHTADFESAMMALVQVHAPELTAQAITSRVSSNGRFIALSVTIYALNRAQLDAIYKDLSDHPQVTMAL